MALEREKSGLTRSAAMDQRPTLAIVLIMVGAHMTVVTARMCPSCAPASH